MKKALLLSLAFAICGFYLEINANSHESVPTTGVKVESPDGRICLTVDNAGKLTYSVTYDGRKVITAAPMGYEFQGEEPLADGLEMTASPVSLKRDKWTPVVKNRHAEVDQSWRETKLFFQEKKGEWRRMEIEIRVSDDGAAFRYHLYDGATIRDRRILRERTGFNIPSSSKAYVAEYDGRYHSAQEGEFIKKEVSSLKDETLAGLPFLAQLEPGLWTAITEADIDNYPGFYIGGSPEGKLRTMLAPLPGEDEDGIKARFDDEITSPWRVILVADNPGKFIESEWIRTLNPPCAIEDPSWIRPGMSAWDHWWSGEVKMEMGVIKEYIDLASEEGWPYMLVDWQWYGENNRPDADVLTPAPQIDMAEVIRYASERGVRIWVWMHSGDANRNDAYKRAFPLYEKWGVAGVKIDFMDRDDQYTVNWYRRVVKAAAEHHLLVDFHGAYKPDGIERTYPNLLTREGVKGGEYNKWTGRQNSAAHNVKLAFTRMVAGPMDYTPGGFLNVKPEDHVGQSPSLVPNTRCQELAKFVVYESPYTVVCDHPDNIKGQKGEDFLKIVPTVWDDIRFIGGDPDTYVGMAKRSGDEWFVGVVNGIDARDIVLDLSFLPEGEYGLSYWADGKNPTDVVRKDIKLKRNKPSKIHLAPSGGYAAVITPLK